MKKGTIIICFAVIIAILTTTVISSSLLANAKDLQDETNEMTNFENVLPEEPEVEEVREGAVPKEWLADHSNGCWEIEDILDELYFSEGTIDRDTIRKPDLGFEETVLHRCITDSMFTEKDVWLHTIFALDFWKSEPDALSWVTVMFFDCYKPKGQKKSAVECMKAVSDFAKENGRPFIEPENRKDVGSPVGAGEIYIRTVLTYNEMIDLFKQGYGIVFWGDFGPGYRKVYEYFFCYMDWDRQAQIRKELKELYHY